MRHYRVKFGHHNSIGLEVVAANKTEAKRLATDVLLENRGQKNRVTEWESEHDGKLHPSASFFGQFPEFVSVEEE